MSFQQKNTMVTLGTFSLILVYMVWRVARMALGGTFNNENVFRMWGVVIVMAIVFTIGATILTHIVWAIVEAVRTREEPEVEEITDERDTLIDLRGTKVTNLAYTFGVLAAMLGFVIGQPALVMFTMLIFSGVVAQIIGDLFRLSLYRRGM